MTTDSLMNQGVDMTVSQQWAKRPDDQRFLTLEALYEACGEKARGSREIRESLRDLSVTLTEDGDDLRLALPTEDQEYEFTNYSFGSLCSRVKAPRGYFAEQLSGAPELAAECLNHSIQVAPDESIMPYVYENGRAELRAATSQKYGRIYDADVARALVEMNNRQGGIWKVPGTLDWSTGQHDAGTAVTKESTTLYASDRDMFAFLCDDQHPIEVGKLPNGEPDLMFRGFYVWNSETGNSSFGFSSMYMRAVCANRILWGVEGKKEITFRHSKNAPHKFLREVAPMLRDFTQNNTHAVTAGVIEAKRETLPKDRKDVIHWIAKNAGVPQNRATAAVNAVYREEGRACRSVWDVAQGLTAVARRIPHQDQRITLERAAKKLLDKAAPALA